MYVTRFHHNNHLRQSKEIPGFEMNEPMIRQLNTCDFEIETEVNVIGQLTKPLSFTVLAK